MSSSPGSPAGDRRARKATRATAASAAKRASGRSGRAGGKGEPSTRLPITQARAVVYLFILAALVGIACLAGLLHYAGELSGQQRTVSREQRELGIEQRELTAVTNTQNADRCDILDLYAAIPLPAAASQAREWETRYEAITRERARQLGCKP